jgi:lysozyme
MEAAMPTYERLVEIQAELNAFLEELKGTPPVVQTSGRKTNQEGVDLIKRWEGKENEAYKDIVGVWTIGYGHTAAAGPPFPFAGMHISDEEAEELLKKDLGKYEQAVEKAVKVPLTDNQFAALVSFTYNLGEGSLRSSTLLKKLNAGDYDAVPSELAKWNKAGGKVVQGLVNRRKDEAKLWRKQ